MPVVSPIPVVSPTLSFDGTTIGSPRHGELAITVSEQDGRTRVALQGELDIFTVPDLRAVLRDCARGGRDVVVDLEALDFLGAQGLSVLLEGRRRLAHGHHRLTVSAPTTGARRLLDLTGLTETFALPPTVATPG